MHVLPVNIIDFNEKVSLYCTVSRELSMLIIGIVLNIISSKNITDSSLLYGF